MEEKIVALVLAVLFGIPALLIAGWLAWMFVWMFALQLGVDIR